MTPRQPNNSRRRGVAATEFALCLPIMVLLVLGMVETCSMVFLKQSLAIAAYEGAHTAVRPGATTADVQSTCEGILRDRRVEGATVTVTPAEVSNVPVGEYMTIQIAAPSNLNGVLPLKFFRGATIQASAVTMKEI
ncbi:pilus assembly protein [Aeoliella sp. ICT_H6.2]|uniref:Pilus assembly protein n=1 Tax=Aeoliella straminimaris TaxID=2954799 RepID=A0A9X2FGJ2_9BACT|nr:TadE family protein [Aeoliella straminimaris]MCO6045261.1 pilus assembly protein [Aeoliella straminimaris]